MFEPTQENDVRQRLDNKVVVVTGASRGIGADIARACADEGARVVLLATRQETGAALIAEWGLSADRAMALALDVRDEAACHERVQSVLSRWGRIDALINNAGIYMGKAFMDYSHADFQQVLDVNLFGVIHMTQAVLPQMREQGAGRIINIASSAGKWGSRQQSAYNVSKHAVVGLTRCVALETAAQGITVNAICPGFVQTDMVESLKQEVSKAQGVDADAMMAAALTRVPMGRVLKPTEISGLAVYLASDESSGMTGQSLSVDGGMVLV